MSGNQPDLAIALGPSGTGNAAAEENITFTCPGLTRGANSRHRDLAGSRNFWAPWSGQASGGKWQPQTYVSCRVARCWKSPFYHLGSCECTYEAARLVCKKNHHQWAVWIVHSVPQGHSSNTRATRPSSPLSHAGTATPPCVRKAPECNHVVLPGEGGRLRVLASRPLQAGKGQVSERRKAHSMPLLSNCWTLCFLKKKTKKQTKKPQHLDMLLAASHLKQPREQEACLVFS